MPVHAFEANAGATAAVNVEGVGAGANAEGAAVGAKAGAACTGAKAGAPEAIANDGAGALPAQPNPDAVTGLAPNTKAPEAAALGVLALPAPPKANVAGTAEGC